MCGICNVVNCIRKSICGCGCSRNSRNSNYNYNGCDRCSYSYNNSCDSRRREPRMNITCANQSDCCFEPCCDNDCRCKRHSSNRCECDD